jgi:large subunit ribosomal protein L17
MRHLVAGRKLGRTSSHRRALLKNLATSLLEHKKIETTEAKAKELRPFAEQLITRAKHALHNEKQGLLADGQKIDVHNRRMAARSITRKAVVQELFDNIAPTVEERAGGYLRIIKTGTRRGDGGKNAIIEFVDYAAPLDGATSLKARRKATAKKAKVTAKGKAELPPIEAEKPAKKPRAKKADAAIVEPQLVAEIQEAVVVDEPIIETPIVVEEPIAEAPVAEAAPVAEEPAAEVIEEPKDDAPKTEEAK